MYETLHPRDDIGRLYVSRKEGGKGLVSIENSVDTWIRWIEAYIKKEQRKANYSDQKQNKQQKHNSKKIKMERKAIVRTFQTTNKRNFRREDLDTAKKGKP